VNWEFDVSALKQFPNGEVIYLYVQSSFDILPALVKKGLTQIIFRRVGPG
jgi:hypothetical protein